MTENEGTLRALIRLIPVARALKDDLERSLHLEMYTGTGDAAVRTFNGLLASVNRIVDDPFVQTLSVDVPPDSGDREKVALVRLASGQLVAYLEGQTGLVGMTGGGGSNIGNINVQKAPVINLSDVQGFPPEMMESIAKMMRHQPDDED